ncbi:MAG: hypothetical protein QNI91_08510 [Arenicellales bacterium]|nr:hypothetical protein [Arenicellales bacterium]
MKNYLVILLLFTAAHADQMQHSHTSEYVGQEIQAIKSLTPEDIAELKRGGGWGLAKAAELNGLPGPLHLLEMKEEIHLSDAQVTEITKIFNQMKSQAIQQGERLIALELELENHFQNRTVDNTILRSSLDAIEEVRKELRYIHLSAHLVTPGIVSEEQIAKYNLLRGYSVANPCLNIPEGHDAEMWRKHQGCE